MIRKLFKDIGFTFCAWFIFFLNKKANSLPMYQIICHTGCCLVWYYLQFIWDQETTWRVTGTDCLFAIRTLFIVIREWTIYDEKIEIVCFVTEKRRPWMSNFTSISWTQTGQANSVISSCFGYNVKMAAEEYG